MKEHEHPYWDKSRLHSAIERENNTEKFHSDSIEGRRMRREYEKEKHNLKNSPWASDPARK